MGQHTVVEGRRSLEVISFNTAFARWVSEPDEQDLSQLIRESLDQLKVIIVGE